jgi:superfamily I DNA/RNA helicase
LPEKRIRSREDKAGVDDATSKSRWLLFLRQDNNEPTPGALILTTMHSSKGLEWDHVWIARSEETIVPDPKSTESEERRLFHVAMTRARESLRVSGTSKNFESRFVVEAQLDQSAIAAY